MSKGRGKVYNKTTNKYNPVVQAKKIEKIRTQSEQFNEELKRLKTFIDSLDRSHNNHISYLGNFARHDIKNAIQNMDSILLTTEPEEFTHEKIESLSIFLNVIRTTMDNFAKLVPYSTNGEFTIDALIVASKLLYRADMEKNNIKIQYVYPSNCTSKIKLPFQTIGQMLNNLLINSIKALEDVEEKQVLVEGEVKLNDLIIRVFDNGREILEEDKDKVFEYGFTTTNGSGIGLFHAKYICEKFGGAIGLSFLQGSNFNKVFTVTLPINTN